MLDDTIAQVRALVGALGAGALTVSDLTAEDLPAIAWSGTPTHIRNVASQLERVPRGEVEYLAVRAPDGTPIAKGGIDYAVDPGAGTIWQAATHAELQGLGIGTFLIRNAERRIRARGLTTAKLGVEWNNPGARALYERLGYVAYDERTVSWEAERDDRTLFTYTTVVTEMQKQL